ncbi:lipoprotein signal peptidase [Aerococcus urinaehominis]|uniref:Lipoprotein signal peptidase n=1 Tax=Aerococcus urinaehominis TaxID=128944 RepID=A0A0X8FK86_9LACT|nr:signal peptidase II [Aerococcus urinaehominis]AMB98840.1 lipoprotein signal peptidase [Aerococcus urinaehominis]SDM17627.1 signal peptidase II [Aerococcus urinaehominis]
MLYYLIIALLVGLDQIVKLWTVNNLDLHTGQPLISGLLSLYYIQNDGAAWGMLSGQMWLFYIITVVILVVLIKMLHDEGFNQPLMGWGLSLIIAGAIGNLIDRLHLNYVVDMFRLEFINFPIFNVADICLTLGVGLLVIYLLFVHKEVD